jgi:hypothetical protein
VNWEPDTGPDLFRFALRWTCAEVTHNGGTTRFEVEEATEPHSWVLRGPAAHRWNGAVVTIHDLRWDFLGKHVTSAISATSGIPHVGPLVGALAKMAIDDVLDAVTWYGTVSFAVSGPKRRMTTRQGIQVNLRRQRFTFEVDGTPATLVMSDGEPTSAP